MGKLDGYEQKLLEGWEDVYKKGQLTLWIMLALKESPKHMADIKAFIHDSTSGTLIADDKSMYRALRRFYDVEMLNFTGEPGNNGPDRKVYSLTEIGQKVLTNFLKRNIAGVFYKPAVKQLIKERS